MDRPGDPRAITFDQARQLLNDWSAHGVFRYRRLGDRMDLEDIQVHDAYVLRLRTQYEDRSVGREQAPYSGGSIDDTGRPPHPWDLPARRPTDFEDRTERTPVPHTESVQVCSQCTGDGLVRCPTCDGWGKVNCPACAGRGFRERTRNPGELDAFGQPTTPGELVREDCGQCFGGKVDCSNCMGHGKKTCAACNGSGRIKTFEVLTVHFRPVALTEVLNPTQCPAHLLEHATGEVLIDQRGPALTQLPEVPAEVDQQARALLQKAAAADENSSRVLFQHLHVQRVLVNEVAYQCFGSESKRLWIYGNEKQLHAPGIPRPWGRVLGIVAGVVGVAVVLLLLAVLLFR